MSTRGRYCQHCGEQLPSASAACSACGADATRSNGAQKSPALAALLSLLVTGTGQIYVGKVARGVGFLVGGLLLSYVLAGTDAAPLLFLVPIVAMFDAVAQAGEVNEGR